MVCRFPVGESGQVSEQHFCPRYAGVTALRVGLSAWLRINPDCQGRAWTVGRAFCAFAEVNMSARGPL